MEAPISDANRIQVAHVREVTQGTTPNTPRMRAARLTGESLQYVPSFITPNEIRSDRMNADPVLVNTSNSGGINIELSYPVDSSPLSDWFESAFFNAWTNTPSRDNDGTADSVITNVATAGTVLTVTTGAAFVAGQLCRFTGFGVAGNNGVFRCTTGSATVPAFVGSGITDEAVPPAAARVKVVGFAGVASDVTATSTGLASTLLDFTTLGLAVGQWIKIGGTAAGDKFANVTANNDWVRITAIAAHALTCDNLPASFNTDNGSGKTIKVWFGDRLANGTTLKAQTIEKGFLDQSSPTYIVQKGMTVDQLSLSYQSEQQITGSFSFMGLSGSESTTPLDASIDAATTVAVMAANVNVGRIAENGSTVTTPNYAKSFAVQLKNNLRLQTAVGNVGAIGMGVGECMVTGSIDTYFGSDALLAKLLAGTVSSINVRSQKDSQALILTIPRVTFTAGSPNAAGKNQDILLPLQFSASLDSTTSSVAYLGRLEYYEA